MPAKSEKQRRLMAAAEHGAMFPMAKKIRASMTKAQMHEFASKVEHESHAYNWRSRHNLKRGQ